MKRLSILMGGLLLLLLSPPLAWTQPVNMPYTPNAGISNTPHDFTVGYTSTTTPGACSVCHTPHKAQTTSLLWNQKYAAGPWSWSDTTKTTAGTGLPSITATWNGATPKCLSCHDGSVAVGDVTWFNAQATNFGLGAPDLTAGKITNTAWQVGAGGSMNGNHPVAVPYPVGQVANTYNGQTNGTGLITGDWVTDPTVNSIVLYTDTAGTVTRVSSSATGTSNGIECSSCHDPHNRGGADSDDYFLRGKLTGNTTTYLCLKCHIK